MASPMEQFEIRRIGPPLHLFGFDISFTNSSLLMCVILASASLLLTLSVSRKRLVPTRMQLIAEIGYVFIADMVRASAGNEGLKFFPFVFTLFIFVLFANFLGLIPGSFTVTSHIIVTFALAIFIFAMVIGVGLWRHGWRFFTLFAPKVPILILPLLVIIEIISFLSRPLSLSVRLFANMLAGHTLLNVFGGFVFGLAAAGGVISVLSVVPLLAIVGVAALEFLVAFLQAYVFAILTCIYLNDALHLHEHH